MPRRHEKARPIRNGEQHKGRHRLDPIDMAAATAAGGAHTVGGPSATRRHRSPHTSSHTHRMEAEDE